MKKFLLGVGCGVLLAGLISVILVFSLVRLADTKPTVADNSTAGPEARRRIAGEGAGGDPARNF